MAEKLTIKSGCKQEKCLRADPYEVDLKKPFPTYIHETCKLYDYICVSTGDHGLQFKITPQDLIAAVPMTIADLTVSILGQ